LRAQPGEVAVVLGKICLPGKKPWSFWVLSTASAILPDADVIGFAFGINYASVFGHRGFFHSILFALLWSLLVLALAFPKTPRFSRPWQVLFLFFFLVTVSHGVLDAMTNGGLGVAFFSPFDNTRYFLPWRPIEVSPISITHFFSEGGAEVIRTEIIYIWIPLLILLAVISFGRTRVRRGHSARS